MSIPSFNQSYIDGQFVTSHGTQVIDLVNPTDNGVIGKVTLADAVDARNAIAAAKKALRSFSKTTREERMAHLQRLHEAVSRRMDDLVAATVLEYGAPQQRAKGSNGLAADIFLHFKQPKAFAHQQLVNASISPLSWNISLRARRTWCRCAIFRAWDGAIMRRW